LQKEEELNCHSLAHGVIVRFENILVRLGEVVEVYSCVSCLALGHLEMILREINYY
jgi:hypothetical protein